MHQHRWQLLCFVVSVYVVASAAFAAAFYLLCLAVPETLDGAKPKGMALIEARPRAHCQLVDRSLCCGPVLLMEMSYQRLHSVEHMRIQIAADLADGTIQI